MKGSWLRWLKRLSLDGGNKPRAGNRAAPVSAAAAGAEQRLVPVAELIRPAGTLTLLILLVMASALLVIYSAYEYRRLFNQHQILTSQGDDLQVEWSQLLLEESAWSANNRVERLAENKLNMKIPEPEEIEIVRHESR